MLVSSRRWLRFDFVSILKALVHTPKAASVRGKTPPSQNRTRVVVAEHKILGGMWTHWFCLCFQCSGSRDSYVIAAVLSLHLGEVLTLLFLHLEEP